MLSSPHANSLRLKLSLSSCALAVVFWLIAASIATLVMSHEIDEVLDSGLQEVAQLVLDLVESNPQFASGGRVGAPPRPAHREYVRYVVRDGQGRILLRSHDARPELFDDTLTAGLHETPRGRQYTEVSADGSIFVTAAEDKTHRAEATRDASSMLIAMFMLLAPANFILSVVVVSRGLRPLRRLQHELEEQADAGFTYVSTAALPVELKPVVHAINGLIDRLERALRAERVVVANSAHEIRTPIAAALAQTQRLVSELPASGAKDRAAQIESALKRLARLSSKLLDLSRADAASVLSSAPQDLGPVLRMLVDDFRREHPQRRIVWSEAERAGPQSYLDRDAFAIVLRNLLENAVKHGRPDAPIDISVTALNQLVVANDGPLHTPQDLARLSMPFERGTTLANGSGLGLTIVRTIAAAARLELQILSPATGKTGGFEVRLQL